MRQIEPYPIGMIKEELILRAINASCGHWKCEFVGRTEGVWLITFDDPSLKVGKTPPASGVNELWQYTWPEPSHSRYLLQELEVRGLVGVPMSTERCVIAVDRVDRLTVERR